jgi:hypothetical protein
LKLFVVHIAILLNFCSFGQEERDSSYIETYRDSWVLRLFNKNTTNTLVEQNTANDYQIKFKGNGNYRIGLGFNYKWLGLNFGLISPLKNTDTDKKGTTEGFDFQTNLYLKKLTVDLHLQTYQGYYLNHKDLRVNGKYPIRKDMTVFSMGGRVIYVFNHKKFSFRAPFLQNERQLVSAGSWIGGVRFGIFNAISDSSWSHEDLEQFIPSMNSIKSISSLNMGITGGYAYTKVFDNLMFLTLSATPSLAIQVSDHVFETPERNQVKGNGSMRMQWRGAFGYNSKKKYLGLTFVNDAVTLGEIFNHRYIYRFGNLKLIAAQRF